MSRQRWVRIMSVKWIECALRGNIPSAKGFMIVDRYPFGMNEFRYIHYVFRSAYDTKWIKCLVLKCRTITSAVFCKFRTKKVEVGTARLSNDNRDIVFILAESSRSKTNK